MNQAVTAEPQTVAELIAHSKQYPLIWMVPDVVQEDGMHILHGAEESFKTMVTPQGSVQNRPYADIARNVFFR